jgi:GT2 family glycosyltransferase
MCVDHDIAFGPTTVAQLVNHDKDIVAGIYRQRRPSQVLEVFNMAYQPYYDTVAFPKTGVFEVGAIGLGCALIKVDVLKKLGYPQFDYHRAVKAEDSLSEDVDFCQKAKFAGYKVFIDPTIRCDHHGQSIYRIDR